LPAEISKLKELRKLNLSHNKLTGAIPELWGDISFELLRLEYNELEGKLPRSLKILGGRADFRKNKLFGPVPDSYPINSIYGGDDSEKKCSFQDTNLCLVRTEAKSGFCQDLQVCESSQVDTPVSLPSVEGSPSTAPMQEDVLGQSTIWQLTGLVFGVIVIVAVGLAMVARYRTHLSATNTQIQNPKSILSYRISARIPDGSSFRDSLPFTVDSRKARTNSFVSQTLKSEKVLSNVARYYANIGTIPEDRISLDSSSSIEYPDDAYLPSFNADPDSLVLGFNALDFDETASYPYLERF
jgi:hypothetical protein